MIHINGLFYGKTGSGQITRSILSLPVGVVVTFSSMLKKFFYNNSNMSK
jgi:hypothetical protein